MGDIGDLYNSMKEHSKDKKRSNLENSKKLLDKEGIYYTEHNNGIHLKIDTIDFWPSTGKWKDKNGKSGRGVFKLIGYIKRLKGGSLG